MSIPVVADADTLFGGTTRGLLMYLDYQGLIKLHWSPLLLDEVSRALVQTGRKTTLKEAKAHEERMRDALPGAMVTTRQVQAQLGAVAHAVHSAKDQHVAACAYCLVSAHAYPEAKAIVLASRNVADFDRAALAALGIELRQPDAFLSGLFSLSPVAFAAAFRHFRRDLRSQPEPPGLLAALRKDGHAKTAQALLAAVAAGTARL